MRLNQKYFFQNVFRSLEEGFLTSISFLSFTFTGGRMTLKDRSTQSTGYRVFFTTYLGWPTNQLGSISPIFYAQFFMRADPKSAKNTVKPSVIFGLLGSGRIKAASKILEKLIHDTLGGRGFPKCHLNFLKL